MQMYQTCDQQFFHYKNIAQLLFGPIQQSMPEISYRQFSADFMNKLKSRRDELLTIVAKTSDVMEMINELLAGKPYSYSYAVYINQQKAYRNVFRQLRLLAADISQTHYEDQIERIRMELDNAFEEKMDTNSSMQLLASMIRSLIKGEGGLAEEPKMPVPQKQKQESRPRQEPEVVKNFKKDDKKVEYISKPFNKQTEKKEPPPSIEKQTKPVNTARLRTEAKQDEPQRKRLESQQSMKDLGVGPKIEVEARNDKPVENISAARPFISGSQLQVQIRYLNTVVDIEGYSYNGFKLKDCLHKYIRKFLKENSLTVLAQTTELLIMEDVNYVKSQDAGNYRFDPFCDAVEIFLRMKNLSKFNGNFTVKDNFDKITISQRGVLPQVWNKNLMKLTPKSTIAQLVDYICKKRQATDLAPKFAEVLIQNGGANIVQDLYGWTKEDFRGPKLQIMPTYIFQVQEIIEQIKDNSQLYKKERPLKDNQKECIKISTSHKILRYAVYKTDGVEGVKKIAWLNMKNLRNAIKIVKDIIYNEELLNQLDEYFNQFALDPDGKDFDYSRGLVLYGPPGTGKTVLTEELPHIIGFHLIEKGLSAADFMKSLVGESSRMIRDLVNRASVSPYLLCSVGIDEVDGLVPDRKDKDEKNKGEGISMLLSVIGGNKDVSNLVFMTSTNYLKKIDQAIRRRLSGQYQVGRPNPWARAKVIQKQCDYFKTRQELLNHLIKITANFTGASLKGLGNFLLKSLKIKKMNNLKEQLTINEITDATILIARQFSIKLGVYTLPEIYGSQNSQKFLFTQHFLERIASRFLIVKHNGGSEYGIMYASEIQRFRDGLVVPSYEREEDKISLPPSRDNDFEAFLKYMKGLFPGKKEVVKIFQRQGYSYGQYRKRINQFLDQRQQSRSKRKTILIIQDYNSNQADLNKDCRLFTRRQPGLYTIFYLLPQVMLKTYGEKFFQNWAPKQKLDVSLLKQSQNKNPNNYTGRIMVELNQEQRMAFQLSSTMKSESKVAFRLFLKSQENISPKAVIPELVDFFTKQNVSYILLIDYQLLLQNDAFEQKKILQVMEEKMMQAKNYEKVAVIINLDSMVMLSQSASDSSMGRSQSYSIQNHNLYQILLNYMREFAMINGKVSRWLTVIAKHEQLIKIAKKHMDWPKYPQEYDREQEQEKKNLKRKCVRCNEVYTNKTNQDERKCMQHPGKIIDTQTRAFDGRNPEILKVAMLRENQKQSQKQNVRSKNLDNRFIYACCLKNINEQGCRPYTHIEEEQVEDQSDELYEDKLDTASKWNKVLNYFLS